MRAHAAMVTVLCGATWVGIHGVGIREASGAEATVEEAEPKPGRVLFGGYLTLLGPGTYAGLAASIQPIPQLEVVLTYGRAYLTADESFAKSSATAKGWSDTGTARLRYWMFPGQSPVLELGAGRSSYSVTGKGSDTSGSRFQYFREAFPWICLVGAGYGYRTDSGFRAMVLGGVVFNVSKVPDGTVSTTGAFAAVDREQLRQEFDWLAPRIMPYLELSVGYMF